MAAEYRTHTQAQQSDLPAISVRDTDSSPNTTIRWFNAQLPDEHECLLTGITCTGETIVVCDNENKNIKRFRMKGKFVDQLMLTDPCGICSLPHSGDIIVTEPDIYRITFCSLEGALTISSTSRTQKKYECIAAFDGVKLVVGCCELGSSCVDVIDCDANILRTIPNNIDGIRLFRNPAAIACLNSGAILISDPGSSQLVCVSTSPETGVQFKYDPSGRPSGVCVDAQGGIFMAHYDSNSVFKLSSSGIIDSVVVDQRFRIKSPLALAFDGNSHLVLTEEMPSTRILIVTLESISEEDERQDTNLSLSNVGFGLH